jgi:hypothetical protein
MQPTWERRTGQKPMSEWVQKELAGVQLGDVRRAVRVRWIVEQLSTHPGEHFAQAAGTKAGAKAMYRFFESEAVEPEGVLEAHAACTWERAKDCPRVLIVQDTTVLDYRGHPHLEGLGPTNHAGGQGLFVHSALALTEEGEPLGVAHQETWVREAQEVGKTASRRQRPWQEKESYKWQRTVEAVVPQQRPAQRFIIIGDRESDVYGLLASPRPPGVELLVRSAQNRKLQEAEGFLHDVLRTGPAAGTLLVEVGRVQERPPRQAHCEVRFREVRLAPPRHADAGVPKIPVRAWAVLIDEPNPPTGEAPLHWVLIATWPIEALEEAIQCVGYYRRRWLVERFHYVLKSGCKIEESQLRTRERLERLEAVSVIVAWRLLSLTYQARLHPEQPCTLVLSRADWQVLYAHYHHRLPGAGEPAPTLGEALVWVAKLGGYWGRKRDAPPGVKVLWRGLTRLHEMLQGFTLAVSLLHTPGDVGNA